MKSWQRGALGLGIAAAAVMAMRWWFRRCRYRSDWQSQTLSASRAQPLALTHLGGGRERVIIIAHGLLKSKNDRRIHGLAQALAKEYDVIAFDFAGHGGSAGACDLDFQHRADELARVVTHAREMGYAQVGVIGCSMGAAAAIIATAQGAPVDALVTVSTPVQPRLAAQGIPSWPIQWVARAAGTRLAPRIGNRTWPISWVAQVAPTPLLVVHNQMDTLIAESDSRALYAVARAPKTFLRAPMALHAATTGSAPTISSWLREAFGDGS